MARDLASWVVAQFVRAVHPSPWVRMSVWHAAFLAQFRTTRPRKCSLSLAYESVASSEPLLPT